MQKKIQEAEKYLIHSYNRYPVMLDHGEDVYLYDVEGKKYLDFGGGIAVCALGYSDGKYKEALKRQGTGRGLRHGQGFYGQQRRRGQ